jgi:hypothetical protein
MKTNPNEQNVKNNDIHIDHGRLLNLKHFYENCKKKLIGDKFVIPSYIAKIHNYRIKEKLKQVCDEAQKTEACVLEDFEKLAGFCQQIIDEFQRTDHKLYYFVQNMTAGEMRW